MQSELKTVLAEAIGTLITSGLILEMIIFVALKRKKYLVHQEHHHITTYFLPPQKVGNGMCLRKLIVMLQSQCKL